MSPADFKPRDPPLPLTAGNQWWHYVLAIAGAALITFWALSLMAPGAGSVDMKAAKDNGAPSDDQQTRIDEDRAATKADIQQETKEQGGK
jgi:hypothetical protein